MSSLRIHLRPILGWTIVIVLLGFPLLSVSNAVDIFLKIGDIKGESKDKGHKDEIQVLAWNWGMSNSGGGGRGSNRQGKAEVQDISFTKYLDISSPALILSTLKGTQHPKAVMSVSRPAKGKGKDAEFLVITLEDVTVTSLASGGSNGEERFTENVTLNFSSFKLEYSEIDEKTGKAGDKKSVEFDISTNKAK
jgi:type VI secretion system secreted protein Hcp